MAKKKKLQAIARPFATSSVPKKIVPPPSVEEDEKAPEAQSLASSSIVQGTSLDSEKRNTEASASSAASNAEKAEQQALQNLVDKLQEKTEKEINRTLKVHFFILFDPIRID